VNAGLQGLRPTIEDFRHVEESVLAGIFDHAQKNPVLAIPIRKQAFEPCLESGRLGTQEFREG